MYNVNNATKNFELATGERYDPLKVFAEACEQLRKREEAVIKAYNNCFGLRP